MAEHPKRQSPLTPSARVRRMRMAIGDAGTGVRDALKRLSGRDRPAITAMAAPEGLSAKDEVRGALTEPTDNWAIGWRRSIKRGRLVLLIVATVAQVIIAVIAWRIKVGRARRRGQPIELD